jgi:hypothetical protein
MNVDQKIQHRRAIEALRSGVPNRDAVLALGCKQPAIEEKFRAQLQAAKEGSLEGVQAPGLLIVGDFGAGKSHLLEYLQHIAIEQNFVCSKVVISKETPLHDPVKLYRSAIHAAIVPKKRGSALTEIVTDLDKLLESEAFIDLDTWVHSRESKLNSRFAATLFLLKQMRRVEELWDRIISFWSGDPIGAGEIKKHLKACGERATYKIEKVNLKDLAIQRFQFAPRLMVAAGYSGWVLLVDEIELIGRYSPLQRAKSYAELARWIGKLPDQQFPGLTCVFAIMSNFESEVLEEKNDLEVVPRKLMDRGLEELAKQAERGMRIIQKEKIRLKPLDKDAIHQTRDKVRSIHAEAYGWQPPSLRNEITLGSTVMRQHVKSWINEWDLERLYPGYIPITETTEIKIGYNEDADLEKATEEESED